MNLTTQQLQTLRAWTDANLNNPSEFDIQAALNAPSSPAFIVWKTLVTRREILQNGFDWTRLDNLSVGKARVWNDMFAWDAGDDDPAINPSLPNIQAGINAVWVGTQADLDVRAAVYAHCKRTATVAEGLLATGTGSTASPGTLVQEGEITVQDAIDIINTSA